MTEDIGAKTMYEPQELNQLAKEIYAENCERGWWDNPNRCLIQALQLVNTELAEATEGDRRDLMDDHLPHRKMAEVEIADAFIRLLDIGGCLGLEYAPYMEHDWRLEKVDNVAASHLIITISVCNMARSILDRRDILPTHYYSLAIINIFFVCKMYGYDLVNAVAEKREYNKQRADHNRENRGRPDGKKY